MFQYFCFQFFSLVFIYRETALRSRWPWCLQSSTVRMSSSPSRKSGSKRSRMKWGALISLRWPTWLISRLRWTFYWMAKDSLGVQGRVGTWWKVKDGIWDSCRVNGMVCSWWNVKIGLFITSLLMAYLIRIFNEIGCPLGFVFWKKFYVRHLVSKMAAANV